MNKNEFVIPITTVPLMDFIFAECIQFRNGSPDGSIPNQSQLAIYIINKNYRSDRKQLFVANQITITEGIQNAHLDPCEHASFDINFFDNQED